MKRAIFPLPKVFQIKSIGYDFCSFSCRQLRMMLLLTVLCAHHCKADHFIFTGSDRAARTAPTQLPDRTRRSQTATQEINLEPRGSIHCRSHPRRGNRPSRRPRLRSVAAKGFRGCFKPVHLLTITKRVERGLRRAHRRDRVMLSHMITALHLWHLEVFRRTAPDDCGMCSLLTTFFVLITALQACCNFSGASWMSGLYI